MTAFDESATPGELRWEGPASAIVRGALVFPGHLSLLANGGEWGGRLLLDVFAPLDESHEIELSVRDAGRQRIAVESVTRQPGIQTATATVILFKGVGPAPHEVFD